MKEPRQLREQFSSGSGGGVLLGSRGGFRSGFFSRGRGSRRSSGGGVASGATGRNSGGGATAATAGGGFTSASRHRGGATAGGLSRSATAVRSSFAAASRGGFATAGRGLFATAGRSGFAAGRLGSFTAGRFRAARGLRLAAVSLVALTGLQAGEQAAAAAILVALRGRFAAVRLAALVAEQTGGRLLILAHQGQTNHGHQHGNGPHHGTIHQIFPPTLNQARKTTRLPPQLPPFRFESPPSATAAINGGSSKTMHSAQQERMGSKTGRVNRPNSMDKINRVCLSANMGCKTTGASTKVKTLPPKPCGSSSIGPLGKHCLQGKDYRARSPGNRSPNPEMPEKAPWQGTRNAAGIDRNLFSDNRLRFITSSGRAPSKRSLCCSRMNVCFSCPEPG
jgi:hypothetical protein